MTDPSSSSRKAFDGAAIALFLVAISAPLADELVRSDAARGPAPENRQAAPKPEFRLDLATLTAYPERYEAFYGDTFGLRDQLLRWHSIEKLTLGVSPTPKILLGRDDWMFTTESYSPEVWRGLHPFRPDELEAWGKALEKNRAYLAQRGIEYLFVIGPNKESIYPERIPPRLNRVGPTRVDQLAEYLRTRTAVRFLDLRPALTDAKADDRPGDAVYLPYGTHWDGRGTLMAYQEILRAVKSMGGIFSALEPMAPSRLERIHTTVSGDSWAKRMYVDDLWPQGGWVWRLLPSPRARPLLPPAEMLPGRKKVTGIDEPGLPRALMFHDSFGLDVEKLLAEHFGHLASEWRYDFDTVEIEKEKPDLVIELFVERTLVERSPLLIESRQVEGCDGGLYRSAAVLYRMDATREQPEIRGLGETRCAGTTMDGSPALEIRTTATHEPAVLPLIDLPTDGTGAICLDVTAPAATTLVIFYKLRPEDEYLYGRTFRVELGAGRNRIYAALDRPDIRGPLAILPGLKRGDYLLHALEVRRLALR
jgi:hypothetical protein